MKGGAGVAHEGRLHDRTISVQCPKAHGVLIDGQPLNADAAFMSQGTTTTTGGELPAADSTERILVDG